MGLGPTPTPRTGDLSADNERSERSILAADDGGQTIRLKATSDGKLQVDNISAGIDNGTSVQVFGESSALVATGTATLASYTVPVGKVAFIANIMASGNCIAIYDMDVDASPEARKHSVVTGLEVEFKFSHGNGYRLTAGQEVKLNVENVSSSTGAFNATILGMEYNA